MSSDSRDRALVRSSCSHCGQPVFADQGYHSVTGNHWECEAQSDNAVPPPADLGPSGALTTQHLPPSLEQD